QMRRIDEAIATYRSIRAIDPDDTEAEAYLALLYLLVGDFELGWQGYKGRWTAQMRRESDPDFQRRLWSGREVVEGRTILVFADEGFGDTIQFSRYLPMLAARGAKVILAVEDALHPVLSGLPGIHKIIPKPAPSLPPFDLHCPIGMLPLAFGT